MGKQRKQTKRFAQPRRADRAHKSARTRAADKAPWLRGKRPVLRFVGIFAILMGIFYFLYVSRFVPFVQDGLFPAYLRLTARVSGGILALLGNETTVQGQLISTPRFSIEIVRGCDALEASALFISAVLAFPVSLRAKLPGVFLGGAVLVVINLIRIVSLYYVGVYWPKSFKMMHLEVWQGLFIVLAILFWVVWANWATRTRAQKADVTV